MKVKPGLKWGMTPRPFFTTRRKIYEILILLGLNIGLYFVFQSWSDLMLFNLGFIWNWAASQPVSYVLDNDRYRFSFLKTVYNLHAIVQLPFRNLPAIFSILPRLLPAGLFWYLVIHFTESTVEPWCTFLGSFFLELTQLDVYFARKNQPVQEEVAPALEFPQDPLP